MGSFKEGFGLVSAVADPGVLSNIGIILSARENAQVITSIFAGYSLVDATDPDFELARLLIVGGRYSNELDNISPRSLTLPAGMPSPLFDYLFSEPQLKLDFGNSGFVIPAFSEATIVISGPWCVGDVSYPTFGPTNLVLNVRGYEAGKADPFGELR